jgi:hypothetical protein
MSESKTVGSYSSNQTNISKATSSFYSLLTVKGIVNGKRNLGIFLFPTLNMRGISFIYCPTLIALCITTQLDVVGAKNKLTEETKSKNKNTAITSMLTSLPTSSPTVAPTSSPTAAPTSSPTVSPTSSPTAAPTSSPTVSPTSHPTSTSITAPQVAALTTLSPTVVDNEHDLNWYLHSLQKRNSTTVNNNLGTTINKTETQNSLRLGEESSSSIVTNSQTATTSSIGILFAILLIFGVLLSASLFGHLTANFVK